MDIYLILLRLIHIFAGVFWAGSLFMLVGWLQPTASGLVPEGSKFMQKLLGGSLPIVLTIVPPVNVLAGLLLYWNDSGGLKAIWILTPPGIGFTIGALAGLAALAVGLLISRPAVAALGALGKQVVAAGKPPTAEQMTKLGALQERLISANLWVVIALTITIAAMAVARYL